VHVEIYTDGSGTTRDSPACIGVVVIGNGYSLVEVSEYVGPGSNNTAELRAIRRGLYLAQVRFGLAQPATLYTDSRYALGCIAGTLRPNHEHEKLVDAIRAQLRRMPAVKLEHVDGHAGIPGNELADFLAGEARQRFLAAHPAEAVRLDARTMKKRPEGTYRRRPLLERELAAFKDTSATPAATG